MFSHEISHFVTVILGYDERLTQDKNHIDSFQVQLPKLLTVDKIFNNNLMHLSFNDERHTSCWWQEKNIIYIITILQ